MAKPLTYQQVLKYTVESLPSTVYQGLCSAQACVPSTRYDSRVPLRFSFGDTAVTLYDNPFKDTNLYHFKQWNMGWYLWFDMNQHRFSIRLKFQRVE